MLCALSVLLRLSVCFIVFVYAVCVLMCDGVWSACDACFVSCSCVSFKMCVCFVCDKLCGVVTDC